MRSSGSEPSTWPGVCCSWSAHSVPRGRSPTQTWWAQPREGDGRKPVDGSSGREAAGGTEGVEAVAAELGGCDVDTDVAGLRGFAQQVSDELSEVVLGPGNVVTSMQECGELGAVVVVGDEGVGLRVRALNSDARRPDRCWSRLPGGH